MNKYSLIYTKQDTFSIIQYVIIAMRERGKSEKEIVKYHNEAISNDFDNVIDVSQNTLYQLNKEE